MFLICLFLACMFGIVIGIILVPTILFLRARRCDAWDDSNMTNILRVLSHLATHPDDFGKMQYEDGSKPFWYLDKDEFTDVVKTRPSNNSKEGAN